MMMSSARAPQNYALAALQFYTMEHHMALAAPHNPVTLK
jgi:hypothetical protein